jgi:hypothetical protein
MLLIPDGAMVYEGDRIACHIEGDPELSWRLHDSTSTGKLHTTFIGDDPLLIDVEQFMDESVTLTVHADYGTHTLSEERRIVLHKIYWGDAHLHADVGDGHSRERIDRLLHHATLHKSQGEWWALDWLVSQSHAFRSYNCEGTPHGGWSGRRDDVNAYNDPGNLTVFNGAEYSPKVDCSGVMHLTVIYSGDCTDLDADHILCAAKNHPNAARSPQEVIDRCWWIVNNTHNDIILYPHHPTAKWYYMMWGTYDLFWNDWDPAGRDRFIRGIELVSKHGNNMDHYTQGVPAIKNAACGHGSYNKFIEYAVHRWSDKSGGYGTDRIFGFHASTDWHQLELDASNLGTKDGPLGRMGVWALYNDRESLFDGMQQGRTFAGDYQNINVIFKIDGQHAFGNWVEVDGAADIEVTAWPRAGSGASVNDLYVVHYDASGPAWHCEVVDRVHAGMEDKPDNQNYLHHVGSVEVEERDALWIATRACNPADHRLHFNGDAMADVPRNPYRTWSSPVWIQSVK